MLCRFGAGLSVAVLLGFLCACRNGEPQPNREVKRRGESSGPDSARIALARRTVVDYSAFRAELRVPSTVEAGRPVPLELVVRNTSERPVWLIMGDSAFAFNFIVTGPHGAVVWSRAHAMHGTVPAILVERPVPPGDSVRFSDTWDQRSNTGWRVPPGTYSVRGTLDTQEDRENTEDMRTDPTPFTVTHR